MHTFQRHLDSDSVALSVVMYPNDFRGYKTGNILNFVRSKLKVDFVVILSYIAKRLELEQLFERLYCRPT